MQLLVTGVMHGDPHSGNLLLRSADGKLCYLDFGLVVRVTPEHRQAMMVCSGVGQACESGRQVGGACQACIASEWCGLPR